jgi:hypothetical protein
MKIQLKTVFGDLIFAGDFSSVAELVKAALGARKSLRIRRAEVRIRPTTTFSDNWTEECAPGIHFYITREEAEAH